ncbi:MAG TPA: aquaporin [Gaiellaceae bacterium]|nr:aquaporin [Gaiellaceae bacterium]
MDGHSLARRSAAEAVGTGLLVFVGGGSIPALLLLDDGKAFTGPDLGLVALAFGAVVAACVYVLGPISGSHINPAVTVAFAATRRFPWREVPAYVTAQLAGAAGGAFLMWGVFGSRGTRLGDGFGLAYFDRGTVSWGSAFLAEAIATAIFLFIIVGAIDHHTPQTVAGVLIGITLAAIVLAIGPLTCAAMNPARVFGPLLVQTVDGSGAHNWLQLIGAYAPAELLGAIVAAFGYDALKGRAPSAHPAAQAKAETRAQRAPAATVRGVAAR